MLTELRLKNFKAFGAEMQTVPMSKITLIYGPNSGGKSSIIQSLLLLKQSVEHFDSLPSGPEFRSIRELTPKGDYVDLGSFPTLVHRHDTTRELELAMSFDQRRPYRGQSRTFGIMMTFTDSDDPARSDSSFLSRIKYYVARKGNLKSYFDDYGVRSAVPSMARRGGAYDVGDIPELDYEIELRQPFRRRERSSHGEWRMNSVKIHENAIGNYKRSHYEPLNAERIRAGFEFRRGQSFFPSPHVHNSPQSTGSQDPRQRVLEAPSRVLNVANNLSSSENSPVGLGTSTGALRMELVRAISDAMRAYPIVNDGLDILDRIIYLGPLRSPPRRSYSVSGGSRASTGIHGQFVPNILYRDEATLQKVNRWFRELELDYQLAVPRLSSQVELIGEQASITLMDRRKTEVTLVDVGFGINQVLPVIIEGVGSPPDSIICVEQPEIHLHPRLQAKLADMVVETAQDGKQWIIETHSEMLIRQIQTRIADRKDKLSESDVSVIYVLRGNETSSIKPMELDRYGEFEEDWPDGFFDDASKKIIEMMRLRRIRERAI